jgi:hypothetical protein
LHLVEWKRTIRGLGDTVAKAKPNRPGTPGLRKKVKGVLLIARLLQHVANQERKSGTVVCAGLNQKKKKGKPIAERQFVKVRQL